MDKELRTLERQLSINKDVFPQWLRQVVRCGRLSYYPQHVVDYYKSLSNDELAAKILHFAPDIRDYQKRIIAFHLTHLGSGNFSELGTAKMETALHALRILFEDEGVFDKCLIITVAARRDGIIADIAQILPAHQDKIRVITYERSWRIEEELLNEKYPIVICDEAHRIKNPLARRSQTAYKLGDQAIYRIALTGVPILNSIEDVFGSMRFIEPAIFGKSQNLFFKKYFDTSYVTAGGHPLPTRTPKPGVEEEIIALLYQHAIRFLR